MENENVDLEIVKEQSYYKKLKEYSDIKIKICDAKISRDRNYELVKSMSELLDAYGDDDQLISSKKMVMRYCVSYIKEIKKLEGELEVSDNKTKQASLKLKKRL